MLQVDVVNGNSTMDHFKHVVLLFKDESGKQEIYSIDPQDAETLGLCILRMAKRVQLGEKD